MAITPIPNRYEGFIFNGENSRTYGVYITEPAVFDAPERDAELITIPGRNGQLVQDNGRWENIQVTYHCALPTNSEADFIQGVQNFRNMLASNIGYQRLEDEINTDEYRLGAFVSGLGVDTINKSAGTFDVVFTCQPQRFLTSGETAVSVASGGTITNPTAYASRPLIEITGYGAVTLGGSDVYVYSQGQLGRVNVAESVQVEWNDPARLHVYLDDNKLNTGDYFEVKDVIATFEPVPFNHVQTINNQTLDYLLDSGCGRNYRDVNNYGIGVVGFYYGTQKTAYVQVNANMECTVDGVATQTTYRTNVYAEYDGYYTVDFYTQIDIYPAVDSVGFRDRISRYPAEVFGNSTKPAPNTVKVDMDTGEAYKDYSGTIVGANNEVLLPALLPELDTGANTITYENTISDVAITPRWWRL